MSLEVVDVCNSLGWGRSLGKELCWRAVTMDCLVIIVWHVFDKWKRHSFVWLQHQPQRMAALVTVILVLFES